MSGDLLIEERHFGKRDTEDESVKYRWWWEPAPGSKSHPTCGPWMDSSAAAREAGQRWLNHPV